MTIDSIIDQNEVFDPTFQKITKPTVILPKSETVYDDNKINELQIPSFQMQGYDSSVLSLKNFLEKPNLKDDWISEVISLILEGNIVNLEQIRRDYCDDVDIPEIIENLKTKLPILISEGASLKERFIIPENYDDLVDFSLNICSKYVTVGKPRQKRGTGTYTCSLCGQKGHTRARCKNRRNYFQANSTPYNYNAESSVSEPNTIVFPTVTSQEMSPFPVNMSQLFHQIPNISSRSGSISPTMDTQLSPHNFQSPLINMGNLDMNFSAPGNSSMLEMSPHSFQHINIGIPQLQNQSALY
eukprot:TRINITY_DN7672_c0_g1_i1.p1 TRINITY_DN7672_c0_g1~~TRINITY_DN7672_c0_g1_i1.p1  ORF type:complete len:299 (+),score=61.87 TRINITY_DN7672_c0_g1_i1:49-945(+)